MEKCLQRIQDNVFQGTEQRSEVVWISRIKKLHFTSCVSLVAKEWYTICLKIAPLKHFKPYHYLPSMPRCYHWYWSSKSSTPICSRGYSPCLNLQEGSLVVSWFIKVIIPSNYRCLPFIHHKTTVCLASKASWDPDFLSHFIAGE